MERGVGKPTELNPSLEIVEGTMGLPALTFNDRLRC